MLAGVRGHGASCDTVSCRVLKVTMTWTGMLRILWFIILRHLRGLATFEDETELMRSFIKEVLQDALQML